MRIRPNAKVDAIACSPLFAQLSGADLKHVASLADELDLPEGKELTREGKPGREFFVILDGTADVLRGGKKVSALHAGDFFGEIALVARRPRTATVKTTTPVRALVITDRSFRQLLDEQPRIQAKVMEALAERVLVDHL